MKKLVLLSAILMILSGVIFAQDEAEKEQFTIIKELPHTDVIDQGSTGTCWSFATTSFLESEIMRLGFPETNLSEMYFVNYNYKNKAFQYLLYQGNNNFGQGSVSHDVMKIVREHGMVPFDSYPGKMEDGEYKHRELVAKLKSQAIDINKMKAGEINVSDLKGYDKVMKDLVGKLPKTIKTGDEKLTPGEFRDKFKINTDDYIELTSFSHHPFYRQFVLEIPDNWAHGLYFNLPIDELVEVMYYALNNGFTVAWDGDTSEKTFRHKKGKADVEEKLAGKVDQEIRQHTYYDRTTTDDHLMHLVGLSKDSEGKNCFYTKNSWGADSNEFGGYLHMTDDYVRLKTIAIMVHKDAIPDEIKTKLGL